MDYILSVRSFESLLTLGAFIGDTSGGDYQGETYHDACHRIFRASSRPKFKRDEAIEGT